MKSVTIIALILCLWTVAAKAVDFGECAQRAVSEASCITRLNSGNEGNTFCNECGNSLYRYYRDCISGSDVSPVTTSELAC